MFDSCKLKDLKDLKIDIKKAIELIDLAWEFVTCEAIANRWLKWEILPIELNNGVTEIVGENSTGELDILLNNFKTSIGSLMQVDMNASEFCEVDSNLITFDTPNDQEILENVLLEEGLVQKKAMR